MYFLTCLYEIENNKVSTRGFLSVCAHIIYIVPFNGIP